MDYLERLAQNPHFRMSPRQLRKLEERRRQNGLFATRPPKQFGVVPKHKPYMEKQDGPARRDTLPKTEN